MSETVFANGLIVKTKDNQPEWVMANLSFKVDDFTKFMNDNQDNGWVNVQLLRSQNGKPYAKLDTWKPEKKDQAHTPKKEYENATQEGDDLPF